LLPFALPAACLVGDEALLPLAERVGGALATTVDLLALSSFVLLLPTPFVLGGPGDATFLTEAWQYQRSY
jgi:hypothetical protein